MRSPIEQIVDQACGVTPEERELHLDRKRADALKAVGDAAKAWWQSHRPTSYSEEQHLHNPTVNCPMPSDDALALAVAELVDLGW